MGSKDFNKDRVGAIWFNTSQGGKEYFSITINDKKYIAFKNDYKQKDGDSAPDYKVYTSRPRPQDNQSRNTPQDSPKKINEVMTNANPFKDAELPTPVEDNEEIPF